MSCGESPFVWKGTKMKKKHAPKFLDKDTGLKHFNLNTSGAHNLSSGVTWLTLTLTAARTMWDNAHCTERNSSGKERFPGICPSWHNKSVSHTHNKTLSSAPFPGTGEQPSISRYRDISYRSSLGCCILTSLPGSPGWSLGWFCPLFKFKSQCRWVVSRAGNWSQHHWWCRHFTLKVKEIQLNLGPVYVCSPWQQKLALEILCLLI